MIKIEEKKLDRLKKISMIAAVAGFAVFIILFIFGSLKLNDIRQDIANKQVQVNTLNKDLIAKKNELGEETNRVANLQKIVNQEYANNPLKQKDESPNDNTANLKIVGKTPVPVQSFARIYLHIGDESQTDLATKLQKTLQAKGYIVPGIENVGKLAPSDTQLRFCEGKDEPSDKTDIAAILLNEGIKIIERPPLKVSGCKMVISDRVYEIWLGNTQNVKN